MFVTAVPQGYDPSMTSCDDVMRLMINVHERTIPQRHHEHTRAITTTTIATTTKKTTTRQSTTIRTSAIATATTTTKQTLPSSSALGLYNHIAVI